MSVWSVRMIVQVDDADLLKMKAAGDPDSDARVNSLFRSLEEFSASFGQSGLPDDQIDFQLTVDVQDTARYARYAALAAISFANAAIASALEEIGIALIDVREIELMPWAKFDEEMSR